MSPIPLIKDVFHTLTKRDGAALDNPSDRPTDPNGLVLEAWGELYHLWLTIHCTIDQKADRRILPTAQGYMVGSLIIMSCITLANMRRGVLLHKLILLEVSLPSLSCRPP